MDPQLPNTMFRANGRAASRVGSAATPVLSGLSQTPKVTRSQLSQTDFLKWVFRSLEAADIRYCVLQRWDALQGELDTDHDVDLAVHPGDAGKLPAAWRVLCEQGYKPIQVLNHAVGSYAFVFGWFEDLSLKTVMVDIAFEHRQGGLIWASGEQLVAARQRPAEFWVAAPQTEFAYLLVKKMLKGTFKPVRERRFGLLVERMGRSEAEKIAGELFGNGRKRQVVEACINGSPAPLLRTLRRRFLWMRFVRNPFNLVRYLVSDALRLSRRWFEPTGVFLVVSGSDSDRKQTILSSLTTNLSSAFGTHKTYRLADGAPEVAKNEPPLRGGNHPTQCANRSLGKGSLRLYLSACFNYILRIRPLLVRTGLVVSDHDLAPLSTDRVPRDHRKRTTLASLLSRIAPKPDLTLLLETTSQPAQPPVQTVSSARRLSGFPVTPASGSRKSNVCIIPSESEIAGAVREASHFVLEYLFERSQRRHVKWLLSNL